MALTNRCITVSYGRVRGKAKKYQYWQPALYQVYYRKSDGVAIWKYVGHIGTARRSARLAKQDAIELHKEMNVLYLEGIRQYKKVFINEAVAD